MNQFSTEGHEGNEEMRPIKTLIYGAGMSRTIWFIISATLNQVGLLIPALFSSLPSGES